MAKRLVLLFASTTLLIALALIYYVNYVTPSQHIQRGAIRPAVASSDATDAPAASQGAPNSLQRPGLPRPESVKASKDAAEAAARAAAKISAQ
jgi:hypothetical protein